MTELRRCTKKYCLAGHVKSVGILQPVKVFKNPKGQDFRNCQTCRDYNSATTSPSKAIIRNAPPKQPPSEAEQRRYWEWLRDIRKPRPEKTREIKHWRAGRLG